MPQIATAADEALAEAVRRYPPMTANWNTPAQDGEAAERREAFAAGAEWQASRPITDEQVEAVLEHRWHVRTGRCACGQHFATEKAFIVHTLEAAMGVRR